MGVGRDKLRLVQMPLVGFMGDRLLPLGTVSLSITAGTGDQQITLVMDFLVVDCPSAYNAILGKPTLNLLRAVTLTYHLLMRFPTEGGVREVNGDQVATRECYIALLKGESVLKKTMSINNLEVRDGRTRVIAEPRGKLEDIILNPNTPKGVTQVGSDLQGEFKVQL